VTTASDAAPLLGTLSQTLWRQQELLELLLYRMDVQQLVLTSARGRWVERADVETRWTCSVRRS
jgi:hypothetical protein